MKHIHLLLLNTVFAAIIMAGIACEGPAGPQGPEGLQGEQGIQGEQGTQGPVGRDGNANVQTFNFTVSASDWSANFHYGSSNIFREYFIPADSTGGVQTASFFSDGGAIVIYANAHHEGGGTLGGWHLLPYMYRSVDGIGVKLLFLASRGSVAITRTTNGWDHQIISADHLPDEVDYRMIFIENTSFDKMAEAGVDPADMTSVIDYFGIDD
jgi:hypothetical protein